MRARSACLVLIAVLGVGAALLWTSRSTLALIVSVCRLNSEISTSPLPCLAVEERDQEKRGYALIREPTNRRRLILTPLATVSGIEDPRLLSSGAHNFFADAWTERHRLLDGLSSVDPWRDLAVGINSERNRSQDQMHIHIACIRPGVRAALEDHLDALSDHPSDATRLRLRNRFYWVSFMEAEDLQSIDPVRFVSESGQVHGADIGDLAVVAVGGEARNGRRGFYILAGGQNRRNDAPASMERLLDPACSLPRRPPATG